MLGLKLLLGTDILLMWFDCFCLYLFIDGVGKFYCSWYSEMEVLLVGVLKGLLIRLLVALGVGYFVLVERKVLGYIQLRKGVNKAGFLGLPLPLGDAAKLFLKENPQINLANKGVYVISPVFAILIIMSL